MTTLSAWWNERFTAAFVRWIEADPPTVAGIVEGVCVKALTTFTGWDWVGDASVAGAVKWISGQTPSRVELLVESGIENWVVLQEAAAAAATPPAA